MTHDGEGILDTLEVTSKTTAVLQSRRTLSMYNGVATLTKTRFLKKMRLGTFMNRPSLILYWGHL